MPNPSLQVLQQRGSEIKSPGAELALLQSRPATHRKHLAHYECVEQQKSSKSGEIFQFLRLQLFVVSIPKVSV